MAPCNAEALQNLLCRILPFQISPLPNSPLPGISERAAHPGFCASQEGTCPPPPGDDAMGAGPSSSGQGRASEDPT